MVITAAERVSAGPGAKSARPWAAALTVLLRAYGAPRRVDGRKKLDLVMLAVLAEERGERTANRWLEEIYRRFVDWNEVRVARLRDLAAAVPEVPAKRLGKLQALLQGMYELIGGLDVNPLLAMKPSEARAWLEHLQVLDREETEALLLVALGVPTLPAGDALVRVCRRMGLAPRKATRARIHKLALKGLAPGSYRDFHDLVGEHAAARCRAEKPDCRRCAVRYMCRSKGKW